MAQPAKAPWLTVVGCLPSGDLAPTAPQNALNAEAIFGSDRLLEAAGVGPERRRPWPKPFGDGIADLLTRRGRPTTVLASGDPLHHGVGATLLRHLPAPEVAVHPAPSAFALAAAELRWPLETATAISLHNSAPDDIRRHLAPAKRLIVLTRDGDAPAAIAAAATASGYGESPVAVLENLGGADARRTDATSATLSGPFAPLNVLAIDAQRRTPVVAADLEHDGCVTRDEIRALTIAALKCPSDPPGHLWDVGAGSGAVAIDWCREGGMATLFERSKARCSAIFANLPATQTNASVLEGDAAQNLTLAPEPDAIFLGGAVGDDGLFQAAWHRLRSGGVFVSNAVTVEGEAATFRRFAEHGGSLTRIALSHAKPVGRLTAMTPAMPVLQWRIEKP